MDPLDDLTEEEREFIFGKAGEKKTPIEISTSSTSSTNSKPLNVENKKDQMVECPLCCNFFSQESIENHAANCFQETDEQGEGCSFFFFRLHFNYYLIISA